MSGPRDPNGTTKCRLSYFAKIFVKTDLAIQVSVDTDLRITKFPENYELLEKLGIVHDMVSLQSFISHVSTKNQFNE